MITKINSQIWKIWCCNRRIHKSSFSSMNYFSITCMFSWVLEVHYIETCILFLIKTKPFQFLEILLNFFIAWYFCFKNVTCWQPNWCQFSQNLENIVSHMIQMNREGYMPQIKEYCSFSDASMSLCDII